MAISFVGIGTNFTNNTTATSLAATLPSGIAAGDVIISSVGRCFDAVISSGTPSGWTFLRNIIDTGTPPAAAQVDLYYRIADGTETTTGPTYTTGATANRWVIHTAVYRGVDNSTPFLTENGQAEAGSGTTHSAPALTNTNAGAWGVYNLEYRQVATPATVTPGTGLTERADQDGAFAGSANPCSEWADTNGTVGTGAVTYSGTSSGTTGIAVMWAAFLTPGSGTTTVNVSDSGSGADALIVAATTPLTDTGSGADAFTSSATVPLAQAGSGADAIAVATTVPLADTGVGTDAVTVAAIIPLAQTGTGTDALVVQGVPVPVSDSGTGANALAVSAVVPLTDGGSASDALIGGGVAPPHVPGFATLAGTGIVDATVTATVTYNATVLAVAPGVATLTGTGIVVATVTAVLGNATVTSQSGDATVTTSVPGDALITSVPGDATVATT